MFVERNLSRDCLLRCRLGRANLCYASEISGFGVHGLQLLREFTFGLFIRKTLQCVYLRHTSNLITLIPLKTVKVVVALSLTVIFLVVSELINAR